MLVRCSMIPQHMAADCEWYAPQRRDCQDWLALYGSDFKPLARFATDTADLADLAVRCGSENTPHPWAGSLALAGLVMARCT